MAKTFYFGYYRRNGVIYPMRWYGDMPVTEGLIIGTKIELMPKEFHIPLADLEAKYPFKE